MADDLLASFRAGLVAAGVCRVPAVAGAAPPMYLEPRDGAPAPGQNPGVEADASCVLSAFASGGIPPDAYESWLRRDTVDVWIRTAKAPTAFAVEGGLRAALIDRRNFALGSMRVVEVSQWRELQRLGSDDDGWTFIVSYMVQRFMDPPPQIS